MAGYWETQRLREEVDRLRGRVSFVERERDEARRGRDEAWKALDGRVDELAHAWKERDGRADELAHARKERDEMRKEVNRLASLLEQSDRARVRLRDKLIEAHDERDEARAEREWARVEGPVPSSWLASVWGAFADACKSGNGEASYSRNHAMARAALQSAADWLRRVEQDR